MGGDNKDNMAGVLQDTVRSSYFLLEKAIEENACAKILSNPFFDSTAFNDDAVIGLARNVLLAIKALPEASQQRFNEQRQYALDMIEILRPAPSYTTSGEGNRNVIF